jgi:hypothetical protein
MSGSVGVSDPQAEHLHELIDWVMSYTEVHVWM